MKPTSVDFEVMPPDDKGRVYVYCSDGWSGRVEQGQTPDDVIKAHREEALSKPKGAPDAKRPA